jgi:3-dehydroquinate synthase
LIRPDDWDALLTGLTEAGLPTTHALLNQRDAAGELSMTQGIEQFREHLGGELNITLPHGIGQAIEVHDVDAGVLAEVVEELLARTPC